MKHFLLSKVSKKKQKQVGSGWGGGGGGGLLTDFASRVLALSIHLGSFFFFVMWKKTTPNDIFIRNKVQFLLLWTQQGQMSYWEKREGWGQRRYQKGAQERGASGRRLAAREVKGDEQPAWRPLFASFVHIKAQVLVVSANTLQELLDINTACFQCRSGVFFPCCCCCCSSFFQKNKTEPRHCSSTRCFTDI